MRSHNFARSVLRCAARSQSITLQTSTAAVRCASLHASAQSAALPSIPRSATPALRTFTTTSTTLKKKAKKSAFAAAEEEFPEQQEENDDDDDLFGSVSDLSSTSTSSSSTTAATQAMSRTDFAQAISDYRSSLDWSCLDKGQFPSLHRWRFLAGHADSLSEFESLLELAKMYRDRVGSLGVESGWRFASRARSKRLPEVALNAFLDRYAYGLEYDLECLVMVQDGLVRKVGRGDREEVLASAELEGSPVQAVDLFGVQQSSEEASQEGAGEGEGKAEAIAEKHQLDMPLARAQVSIVDRMCLVASLSSHLSTTSQLDPLLLSYITRAYIQTFHLTRKDRLANPLLSNIFTRTDQLVSLLTTSAQRSISSSTPHHLGDNKVTQAQRSANLRRNLSATLAYVAVRGQQSFKGDKGEKLDPVRTLYRLMESVDRQQSGALVRKVEPLLQTYRSI